MDHSYISPDLPIYNNPQKPLPLPTKHSQSTQHTNPTVSETGPPIADNARTQPYYIPIPSPNKLYSYPPNDYHTNVSGPGSIPEQSSSYTLHNFSPVLTSPLATTSFDPFQYAAHNSSIRNVQRSRSKRYQSVADPSLKLRSAFRKPPSSFEAAPPRRVQNYSHIQKVGVLKALTTNITKTYQRCNPAFTYELTRNPRRVLTKPSKAVKNDGYDNENNDFILYVNDVLGDEAGHQYLVLEILGAGTFGQVAKCLDKKTNELVGVKVVKNKQAYFQQSIMEVKILEWLNEKFDPEDKQHILRLLGTFVHRRHLCLVFELLSVNLYELIKQNQFRGLSTNLVRVFISQILDALCVLKEAKIIHCDLKPENILLKSLESATIKVIDFGSACHEQETVYTYIQSRFYRSPEILLGLPYTTSIDMWSLGCIAIELYLGLPLFPGSSEYNQLSRIVEMLGTPPAYMIEVGKNGSEYFERVLDHDNQKTYHLKSMEQYAREHNCKEQPSKRYFSATNLPDLIRTYPLPKKSMPQQEIDKEMKNREMFLDFVQGLLNLNPLERWSPHQATLHPFISGAKYTGHFIPPTMRVPQDSSSGPESRLAASNLLGSVPSPKDKEDASHLQDTYVPQEPDLISDQIRPKAQPHYQPSLLAQNQEDAPNLNHYQSQIPGLNLAPDHTTSTQNSATPFFKQNHRTGRSRANTVSGAHISGDVPIQLQRYAVMSSANCSASNNEPEIVVTVDAGSNAEGKRKKALETQTQAIHDELASIGVSMNKSDQIEVVSKESTSNVQYPSPNTAINNHPLPIRPAYTTIPKFQGGFPILPATQTVRPPEYSNLNFMFRPEVKKPDGSSSNHRALVSSDPLMSPRGGLGTYGMNISSRPTDIEPIPNSYEEKPSYLQSPMANASLSYVNSKPPTTLKVDTRFNQDFNHARPRQSKFEPVSPYHENPVSSTSQGYFSPGSKPHRDTQVHFALNSSPPDIQSTQHSSYAYSNTSSGLGLYGVSQTNPSETQHSSHQIANKSASLPVLNPGRSPQSSSAGHNMHLSPNAKNAMPDSRIAYPQKNPTNPGRYGILTNHNPFSYSSQQPPDMFGQSPRKNPVLTSPRNNDYSSSPNNRSLKNSTAGPSDYPRRIYQEYPLQEVTSEEPAILPVSNAKFDAQHRGVSLQSTMNTSQSSPRETKSPNCSTNHPAYETSPKQYQARNYAPTTRIVSPLVNVTNASYKSQSHPSPYQESMSSHSSHRQPPMANNHPRQPSHQPSVQLQSIFVPTNEELLEPSRLDLGQHANSDAPNATHTYDHPFDLDYRPSNNSGVSTSHGLYKEETLPVPTSMPTSANANQRKQWFDVKSYFGHGSRTKHKEKPADLLPVAFSPTSAMTASTSTVKSTVTAVPQHPLEGATSDANRFEKANTHYGSPYFTTQHFSPNLNSYHNQQQSPSISSRAGPSQNQYDASFDGNMRRHPAPHSVPIPVPGSSPLSPEDKGTYYPPHNPGTTQLGASPSSKRQSSGSSIGIMVDYLPQ